MSDSKFSALQIGVTWQRLAGMIDEAAQTFLRTSFSSVVRARRYVPSR